MGKLSVNSSKKRSSAKKNAAKTDNPSMTKKLSNVEKFADRMRKKCKKTPANIIDNVQVHPFDENGEAWAYILSTTKPAMGFYGCLTSDEDPFKWAITVKDENENSIVAAKEKKLLKLFNEAKAAAQAECNDSESEAVDVVVDQSGAGQSKEPANDSFETTVSRLSALLVPYYDLARKSEAKRLGIRVSTLDKAVANENIQVNALKIIGPSLFLDVHEIVTSLDFEQISTTALISELCASNNKHWSVFNCGDRINPKQLAHILNLYGVNPRDIRFKNVVLKGYTRESILAAYSQYITPTIQQ